MEPKLFQTWNRSRNYLLNKSGNIWQGLDGAEADIIDEGGAGAENK